MNKAKDTVIVVFGGTGDLMRLKIAPALFTLKNIKIIGCGRSDYRDETYFTLLHAGENFEEKLSYLRGDLHDDNFYKNLNLKLQSLDYEQVIFYCSIMPALFPVVIPKLKSEFGDDENLKLIIEKPFGLDEKSAKDLNDILSLNFKDEQIFRVEHYLAKDMIQFISKFRFSNPDTKIYEKYFNNQFVESIEVTLQETIDVDKRGDFYDGVGTLRDVGQNHILQMLALSCCENPQISGKTMGQMKAEFFENNLDFTSTPDLRIFQYEGYKNIKGVQENSQVETAFVINTKLVGKDMEKRWDGVKVKLEAGKALKDVKKQIKIYFKNCDEENNLQNIIFDIVQNKVFINFKNESQNQVIEVADKQKMQYIGEYSKLFGAAIAGTQSVFVSWWEVKLMWRFIDQYLNFIKENNLKPEIYSKGELVL